MRCSLYYFKIPYHHQGCALNSGSDSWDARWKKMPVDGQKLYIHSAKRSMVHTVVISAQCHPKLIGLAEM